MPGTGLVRRRENVNEIIHFKMFTLDSFEFSTRLFGLNKVSPGTGLVRPRGCCVSTKASSIRSMVGVFANTKELVFSGYLCVLC
jgi:hypothetical protein